MNPINVPEILAANGTAMVMVVFLLLFHVRKHQRLTKTHTRIFRAILYGIILAAIGETTSFLIDGQDFPLCAFLQYVTNTLSLSMVIVVGFLWCLFVDYRLYRNKKRLYRKAIILGACSLPITSLLIVNLFGTGIIFTVLPDNRYVRGEWNILLYVMLFAYFIETIVNASVARKRGVTPFFFPIYCFIIPCMIGTVLQGFFYGLSIGWLAAAMSAVFVSLEMQTVNYYVDGLSGLFNRQYMNYFLHHKMQQGDALHGIMLDVNDFKSINDHYGHAVGDRAIHITGKLLSKSIFQNAVAMRIGGDEFVVFLSDGSDEDCQRQMDEIQKNVDEFNHSGVEPFRLSISGGRVRFDGRSVEEFLSQMDAAMYAAKRKYHASAPSASDDNK